MTDPQNKSLTSYAAAYLSIYLQAHERGLELPLRGVCMVLCEDDRTVIIEVPAGHDWIMASFELPRRVNPETFEPGLYLEGFATADVPARGNSSMEFKITDPRSPDNEQTTHDDGSCFSDGGGYELPPSETGHIPKQMARS